MRKAPMWRRYLRFWGTDVEADVEDELEFHLESRTEDLIEEGWSPNEARAEAQRRFGELETVRQECIDLGEHRETRTRRRLGLDVLRQNIRYGFRLLLQKPGFAITAILSLAIGIGANTAIFSVVNSVLFREPPLRDPSQVVDVYMRFPEFPYFALTYPDYDDLVAGSAEVFEGVVASNFVAAQSENEGAIETVVGEAVTGNYFQVLGVGAHLGRTLLPQDDVAPGAHPVVVLGYSHWQSRFGADPNVVGTSTRLADRSFEIVGVAPQAYPGNVKGLVSAFYAPRMMVNILKGSTVDLLQERTRNRDSFVKARLRPDVSVNEAQAVVSGIAEHLREQNTKDWDPQATLIVVPTSDVIFHPSMDPWVRATAWLLVVVVGLVLLMACANLAGFLLAQAVDRRKEVSLRLSLGATRRTLITQLLTESLVLAVLGGAAGLIVAVGLLRVRIDLSLPVPIELEPSLDPRVLVFAVGITLLAGLFLGLAPALSSTKTGIANTLREEGAGGGRPGKLRLRSVLIGAQVGVSTVLVVGAGLFLRSFQETSAVDPGFGRDPAALMRLLVPASRFDPQQGRQYVAGLVDRFEEVPGVLDVGVTNRLHLGLGESFEDFNVDGVEPPPELQAHSADNTVVGPGFFEATGVRIVSGRNFNEHDRPDSPPVAIVSAALANRFFPGDDAVGQPLRKEGSDDLLIIGVASDAMVRSIGEEPRSFIYRAYSQDYRNSLMIVARTSRDSEAVSRELARVAKKWDPDFRSFSTTTMQRHLGATAVPAQLQAMLLSAFAVVALALAAIGLYGIVSYSVSQRTREVAIRLSMGADSGSVVRMLMSTGLRAVLIGGGAGLLISLVVNRFAAGLLFGVSSLDPWTFLGTVTTLTTTAVVATWLPARQVSRVTPVKALRFE